MPLQGHAAVAKAGIDALSATIALEYGPRGVTSNIITPGPILGTEGMARLGNKDEEKSGEAYRKVPLQRYGSVKEIADGGVYVFSDAGNYVKYVAVFPFISVFFSDPSLSILLRDFTNLNAVVKYWL